MCVCVCKKDKNFHIMMSTYVHFICTKKQKWFVIRGEGPNIGMKEWIIIRTKAFARASVEEPSSFAGLADELTS